MWLAPATMAWTKVKTLRPGRNPPARSVKWTVASTKRLQAQTGHQRRHQDQPGVGHQSRLVENHLHTVNPAAILASLKVPPGFGQLRLRHRNRPRSGGLSRGWAT